MKKLLHEVFEEFKIVFKGKTLDTLIPPIIFLIMLNIFDLTVAIIVSISLSITI